MLRAIAFAAMLALVAPVGHADPVEIDVTRVPLIDATPDKTEADKLKFRGGLHLVSREPRFGGFSALGLSADGTRMVSISDAAQSLSATLTYDEKGDLSGLSNPDLSPLADLDGTPMPPIGDQPFIVQRHIDGQWAVVAASLAGLPVAGY